MAAVLLDEVRLNEGLRDRERLVKVESLLEESHKHVATREDVQAVRTELVGVQAALQAEIAGVKSDLQAEIAGVKSDLQAEIAGVRIDVQSVRTELVGVQTALQSEIADVRSELADVRSELKSEIADVKSDMRWLKWLLGIGASLGVAIGTGVLLLLLRMAGGL